MSNSSVMKLEPIRMAELIDQSATGVSKAQGYMAPHLRTAALSTGEIQPDFNGKDFPSLGQTKTSVKSWGKPIANAHPSPKPCTPNINFKGAVESAIEQEKLEAAERSKQPEEDYMKMTNEELKEAGWVILPRDATRIKALCNDLTNRVYPFQDTTYSDYSHTLGSSLCPEYERRADSEMDEYRPKELRASKLNVMQPYVFTPFELACFKGSKKDKVL